MTHLCINKLSLVHILACCLVGWNIVNWTPRNKLQWNFNPNSYIFIQENVFQNVICKMAAILSLPQCDKTPGPFCVSGFPVIYRCRFLNSLVMCVPLTLTTYVVSSTTITQLQHNTVYYTQRVTEGDQGNMSLKIFPSHIHFKFDRSSKFYLNATIFAHGSCAIIICAKFCSDIMAKNEITEKNFIGLNYAGKIFNRMDPGAHFNFDIFVIIEILYEIYFHCCLNS